MGGTLPDGNNVLLTILQFFTFLLDYVLCGSVTWRVGGTLADGENILIDRKTTFYTLAQLRTLLWCRTEDGRNSS